MKKALITGMGGQDGSYLAEYLLSLGYEVHGMVRKSKFTVFNLKEVMHRLAWHHGDVRDAVSIDSILRKVQPDEIYNLAGQVFVPTSWDFPKDTFDINTTGLSNIINVAMKVCPKVRIYQASTSEMFGNYSGVCQEDTEMKPVSPYGISKLAAHEMCRIYRDRGMFCVSGILFNHESPRRGPEMLTRKITQHVASWVTGDDRVLKLGNLTATRDWGYAKDYVEAMHLMLQQDTPDDFVIGTGKTNSIKDFLNAAVEHANLTTWFTLHCDAMVQIDQQFARPNEVKHLEASFLKAKRILGWEPKTSFAELVGLMVDYDITEAKRFINASKRN